MQSRDKLDYSFYVLEGIFQNLYCRTYILENAKKLDNNEKLR